MTWRMFLFLSHSQRIIRAVVYFTTRCTEILCLTVARCLTNHE